MGPDNTKYNWHLLRKRRASFRSPVNASGRGTLVWSLLGADPVGALVVIAAPIVVEVPAEDICVGLGRGCGIGV